MSDQIAIDTGIVVAAANCISTLNNEIDFGFTEAEYAIQRLNSKWNSRASDVVIGKFYSLKNNFKDCRYKVLQDYSNLLKQQVSVSYNSSETVNTSLANAFK